MAAIFDAEEIRLEREEARALSDALNKLAGHYEKTLNPAVLVWVNLMTVTGTIFGPKLWKLRQRKKNEEPARPDNVAQMPMRPSPAAQRPAAAPAAAAPAQTPSDIFGDYNGAALPDFG